MIAFAITSGRRDNRRSIPRFSPTGLPSVLCFTRAPVLSFVGSGIFMAYGAAKLQGDKLTSSNQLQEDTFSERILCGLSTSCGVCLGWSQ